jgi:sn-glycerol 3-phosphate transport system substrate-binding protein
MSRRIVRRCAPVGGIAISMSMSLMLLAACGSDRSIIEAGLDDPSAGSATTMPGGTPSTGASSTSAIPDGPAPTGTTPEDGTTPDSGTTSPDETTPSTGTTPPAGTSPSTSPSTSAPIDEYPACPTAALDTADGTVEVTYWHGLNADNEEALQFLTDRYNAEQDRVRVTLQNQGGYLDVIDKYYQSGGSARPDIVMFPEYGFQQAIDSDTIVPAEACIRDADFDSSVVQPSALQAYSSGGIVWGMPFNVSNPILFYNKLMFEAAGLDPEQPPRSFDELRSMSQQLVDSGAAGYGIALDTNIDSGGGWFIEQWFAGAGELFVNNGNGREAPATEVLFDGDTGIELFTLLQDLVDAGLAVNVGDNSSGTDNFLKMADDAEPAAMTIGTSAALGTVISVLGSGLVPSLTTDDVGVGPLPGFGTEATAIVGGAANYVVAGKDPEVTAAAWDFLTYLITPEIQSEWAVRTGYLPLVDAALDIDPLATTYASDPRFRVAYEQLANSPDDLAHAGPQIGPHRQIRDQTAGALATIFDGADVAAALADAATTADALLQQYAAVSN